mmetsp:Transcript_28797/g.73939  ORF Transcript_28797/g.73939 Transcript_28797/m.73939 type:complete len:247 (+) Transcript_28797:139-879(+)
MWHVLECAPHWSTDDQAAEVAMLKMLHQHPARVHDPDQAVLFVLPILPYVSFIAGECNGETHERRMSRAATFLQREPAWLRVGGHDHLIITNTFRVRTFGLWLKPLLCNATVAWFEQPAAKSGVGTLHKLAFWRCTIVIPYLANPFCALRQGAFGEGSGRPRSDAHEHLDWGMHRPNGSIFFQGSWHAARYLRARFSELQSLPASHIFDIPRNACSTTSAPSGTPSTTSITSSSSSSSNIHGSCAH